MGDIALEQATQGECVVSVSGGFQNLIGQVIPVQPDLGKNASAGGLDWMIPRSPFQPVLFCEIILCLFTYAESLFYSSMDIILCKLGLFKCH